MSIRRSSCWRNSPKSTVGKWSRRCSRSSKRAAGTWSRRIRRTINTQSYTSSNCPAWLVSLSCSLFIGECEKSQTRSVFSRTKRLLSEQLVFRLLMILVFDGHVWNMKLLDPDVFTSFSLASLTELPAAILLALFLDRWGRRWMGFASMFTCGIFSFIAIGTPAGKLHCYSH